MDCKWNHQAKDCIKDDQDNGDDGYSTQVEERYAPILNSRRLFSLRKDELSQDDGEFEK